MPAMNNDWQTELQQQVIKEHAICKQLVNQLLATCKELSAKCSHFDSKKQIDDYILTAGSLLQKDNLNILSNWEVALPRPKKANWVKYINLTELENIYQHKSYEVASTLYDLYYDGTVEVMHHLIHYDWDTLTTQLPPKVEYNNLRLYLQNIKKYEATFIEILQNDDKSY